MSCMCEVNARGSVRCLFACRAMCEVEEDGCSVDRHSITIGFP